MDQSFCFSLFSEYNVPIWYFKTTKFLFSIDLNSWQSNIANISLRYLTSDLYTFEEIQILPLEAFFLRYEIESAI